MVNSRIHQSIRLRLCITGVSVLKSHAVLQHHSWIWILLLHMPYIWLHRPYRLIALYTISSHLSKLTDCCSGTHSGKEVFRVTHARGSHREYLLQSLHRQVLHAVVPASHTGIRLCPSCFIFTPVFSLWPEKAAEVVPSLWYPVTRWNTWKKLMDQLSSNYCDQHMEALLCLSFSLNNTFIKKRKYSLQIEW